MRSLPEMASDITRAETLPGWAYTDPEVYAAQVEQVFARSWQFVCNTEVVRVPGEVFPFVLLEGSLHEPLVLTRDEHDRVHALSNVCTHRGHLVVLASGGVHRHLTCRYHGRRFGLDGRFEFMPEMKQANGFPRPCDSLPKVACEAFGPWLFVSLDPAMAFDAWVADLRQRLGHIPWSEFRLDPSRSRDYLVQANWMTYCDNYLEGFHIPYVHASLNEVVDYGQYRTELFEWGSLQVGVASRTDGGTPVFDLPSGHPDAGQRIAAYYYWLWPNTMLNVYPWGLSVNLVQPLGVDRTRVRFRSYVWNPHLLDHGAGADLDRVEREDEAVVERVQVGLRSRLYKPGRYSPSRESGVHHFHRLVTQTLRLPS